MGLREEMNRRILFPVILGVLLTAIMSCLIMLIRGPSWVSLVEDRSMDEQIKTLTELSTSISVTIKTFFQAISDDMMSLNHVYQRIYAGEVYLNDTLMPKENSTFSNTSYFTNARTNARLTDNSLGIVPDFNYSTNISYSRSMWYIPCDVDQTTWEIWNNVPPELQRYYIYTVMAVPYMQSLVLTGQYSSIYTGFRYDGVDPSSILSQYPLVKDFETYMNFSTVTTTDGDFSFKQTYYDFAKRPWWKLASRDQSLMNTVIFTDPYPFAKGGFGNTVCTPYFSEEQFATDIRVTCMDFSIDKLNQQLDLSTSEKNATFFVIRKSNFIVVLHPNLNYLSDYANGAPTIQQLEFRNKSAAEASAFEASLKALNLSLSDTNTSFEYIKDSLTYVLTLKAVNLIVSADQSVPPTQFLLGISKLKSEITGPFAQLDSDIISQIIIQIFIILGIIVLLFIVAWVLINMNAKYLSRPIDELVRYVKVLKNFSEDAETSEDYDAILELSKLTQASYSMEINTLFINFQNTLDALKFAKEGLNTANDAQALMIYSKALKLYQNNNNTRGIGIIYNNIANVHLRNGRYEEAIECYKESIDICKKEITGFKQVESSIKQELAKKAHKKKAKGKKRKPTVSLDALEKIRWQLEEQLNNRYYQLGRALISLASKYDSGLTDRIWTEVLDIYAKVITSDKDSKRNQTRVILCMLDIANAYVETGNFKMAEQFLNELDQKLQKLLELEGEASANEKTDLLNTYSIPVPILRQKFLLQKGRFLKRLGKKKEACRVFTEAIESGKKYDPSIRKQCLIELKQIFEENNLLYKAPNIKRLLDNFVKRDKDIIILLDYSQSMGDGGRINFAVNNILKVFDNYIKSNDRVGFIRFNMNCDIIFSLVEKKKNTSQLRKQLENSLKPSGGTALFTAIYEAIKLFQKADQKNHTKWIVALTDGDDNESRISFEQIFKMLARCDINLIIIGLALHPAVGPKLSYLCKATKDGVFIESPNNESLDLAFQAVSDIIYGQEVTVENITI